MVKTGVWTSVETPLAIVCACLPTLPAYFKSWYQKMTLNRSKGTNSAPFVRFFRSFNRASELALKSKYENLEARGATPLNEISPAKKCGTEADGMGSNQIHVSHQFTVESREHS